MIVAVGALIALPVFVNAAQARQQADAPEYMHMTITITDTSLSGSVDKPVGGLYILTVRNDSSNARGLVIRGTDYCCSPYTRLVKILRPGQQKTFRWYFPDQRSVEIRDLIRCDPAPTACSPWVPGEKSLTLRFP